MKTVISIFLIILTCQTYCQTTSPNWKTILTKNEFKVTKDKKSLPDFIVTQIADTITDFANPNEKWDSSCNPNGLPRLKLNWIATDGQNWIVCYTHGGYSAKTVYELFTKDTNEKIQNPGWTGEKFKSFKKQYLSGTLKKGSLY